MCGRYTLKSDIKELEEVFEAEALGLDDWQPVYNATPQMRLPVLLRSEYGQRILYPLRWGFIPPWGSPDSDFKMINARKDRLTESKAWRPALMRHRCIVPANGFFEWKNGSDKSKQPYYIYPANGGRKQLFGLAGLYSKWKSPEGEVIPTYSIITVEANDKINQLHSRMPAILRPDDYDSWLETEHDTPEELLQILGPANDEEIDFYPVSRDINRTRKEYVNEPYLIEPVE